MPCVYDDFGASERERRKELDEVTDMLCQICLRIDEGYNRIRLSTITGLEAWWGKHKIADEARRKSEAQDKAKATARSKALAKLTAAEKEMLGL